MRLEKHPQKIIISAMENPYIAVSLTEDKLILTLKQFEDHFICLDKKILPYLVDALIELQNK
jgi:hypothetical protein